VYSLRTPLTYESLFFPFQNFLFNSHIL
jgi:hypothetical protein